jgi:hypothetical protein
MPSNSIQAREIPFKGNRYRQLEEVQMLTSFVEWVKLKELQELEEGRRQDLMAQVDLTKNPEAGDIILFDPDRIVSNLPTDPHSRLPDPTGGRLGEIGEVVSVNHDEIIISMNGEEIPMIRPKSHHFRDITDAFESTFTNNKLTYLLYVHNDTKYDSALQSWRISTKPQSDSEMMAMAAAMGDTEEGDNKVAKKVGHATADKEKARMYQMMADRLSHHGLEDPQMQMLLKNMASDMTPDQIAYWQRSARRGEPQGEAGLKIVNAMRKIGLLPPEPGEPFGDPSSQAGVAALDDLVPDPSQQPIRMDPAQAAARTQLVRPQIPAVGQDQRKLAHHDIAGVNRWKMFRETKQYHKYPVT